MYRIKVNSFDTIAVYIKHTLEMIYLTIAYTFMLINCHHAFNAFHFFKHSHVYKVTMVNNEHRVSCEVPL